MQEMQVWSLCWEEPLEEGVTTHSSTFAWKISLTGCTPWSRTESDMTEATGQARGLFRDSDWVGLKWVTGICILASSPRGFPEQSHLKSPHIIHDVWKRSFGAEDSGRFYTTVFHNTYYCKPKASCQSSNSKYTTSQNSLYCIPAAWLDSQIAPRLRLDGFKSLKRHTTRIISHP